MMNAGRAVLAIAVLALASCSREGHINQPFDLSQNQSLAIDAQQRVVTNVVLPAGQERTRVVCAEPSPDVAAAIAKSLGASLAAAVTPPAGGTAVEARGELARSYAQKLTQLGERTNTIQLLRDSLYRACEAYANGAISKTTYALLLSRYDSLAVTLAMGELAAGAFGRPLATAGVETTATTKVGQGERPTLESATTSKPTGGEGPGLPGEGRVDSDVARTLMLMQEAYLVNNAGLDLGPIVATCVTALTDPAAQNTRYATWCDGIFKTIGDRLPSLLPQIVTSSGALQQQLLDIEASRVRQLQPAAEGQPRTPRPPPARPVTPSN